jgi:hypothetical protein
MIFLILSVLIGRYRRLIGFEIFLNSASHQKHLEGVKYIIPRKKGLPLGFFVV